MARRRTKGKGKEAERKFDDRDRKYGKTAGRNDVSWYTHNPQLTRDAGNIAYTWPIGYPIDLKPNSLPYGDVPLAYGVNENLGNLDPYNLVIPGVMRLDVIPTFGIAKNANDPLNVSMFNIYAKTRYMNSGASNYDPPDQMLMLIAVDSLRSFYSWCVRLYGAMMQASFLNKYIPRAWVYAMGVNYDDMLKHVSDFRAFINTMSARVSTFIVPPNMDIFKRHMMMFSNVYADERTAKHQDYIFNPYGFWKYNEVEGAGRLDFVTFRGADTYLTFDEIVAYWEDIYNACMMSEDIGIMIGDIAKVWPGSESGLPMISENYSLIPYYDTEILQQIHNASIFEGYFDTLSITQNVSTGTLVFDPTFRAAGPGSTMKKVFSTFIENPTPENVLIDSRLANIAVTEEMNAFNADGSNVSFRLKFNSLGSEVVTNAVIYRWLYTDNDLVLNTQAVYGSGSAARPATGNPTTAQYRQVIRAQNVHNMLSAFNWHPLVKSWVLYYDGTVSEPTALNWYLTAYSGEISNYAVVDEHDLAKMHQTSILSMFDIPTTVSGK